MHIYRTLGSVTLEKKRALLLYLYLRVRDADLASMTKILTRMLHALIYEDTDAF